MLRRGYNTDVFLWNLRNFWEHLLPQNGCFCLFWDKKVKMEKHIHRNIHIHRKRPLMVSFLVQLHPWGLAVLRKKNSILDGFCEICKVLQSLIFTKDSWATASDFQQHFGHVTCSISNKSAKSQLTICLGPPKRAARKQFRVFISKIFKIIEVEGNVFSSWGRRNEQKKGI